MVARLLRLKLALLRGEFRRSVLQLIGMVIGLAYGLGLTVWIVAALVGARFAADVPLVRDLVVVAGVVVTLGFLLLPLVFGVDDTLDPRAFALFGIPPRQLAAGLGAAGALTIPGVALVLCALASIVTWSHSVGATIVAVIGAAFGVATCVLASRVAAAAAGILLDTRRSREVTGVLGLLLVIIAGPALVVLLGLVRHQDPRALVTAAADVLRWTPFGAPWAAPADASLGHWGAAIGELFLAASTVVLLLWAWQALVARILVSPGRTAEVRLYGGLGWFSRLPQNRWGAVAARSLTYWGRDPRYWVALIVIPIIPGIAVGGLWLSHAVPGHILALLPLPVMALFLGWSMHNDVAYDGTAVWLHLAAGVSGRADRIGRAVPVLGVGIILVAVGAALTAVGYGDPGILPAAVGVALVLLLAGLGISSITSALVPYPVAQPGQSPFQQPQSTGSLAALVQSVSLFIVLLVSIPAIGFGVLFVLFGGGWAWASLAAGAVLGLAAGWGGIALGSLVYDRRGPEILDAAITAA